MNLPFRHASNEITSGILHLVAGALAVAVLVLLIVFASLRGDSTHVVSFTIFGVGMILLYSASAIYHLFPYSQMLGKSWLQKIDHSMVYVFIAATYTPVCLLVLPYSAGFLTLSTLWGLALVGIVITLFPIKVPSYLRVLLYLVMGWFIVLFIPELKAAMSMAELWLLIAGGICYTVGVIFFVLEAKVTPKKYFWMHEIFHIFVIAGSTLHTIVMFFLLW